MGVHELWSGGVSDINYLNKSGILEYQQYFTQSDLADGQLVTFTNVLDKGYRSTVAAWRSGSQLILQPDFASSDRKFRTLEVISSAAIATDCSGNERAVRLSKQSKRLKHGATGHTDYDRLADTWVVWSFIANFMYSSVI